MLIKELNVIIQKIKVDFVNIKKNYEESIIIFLYKRVFGKI